MAAQFTQEPAQFWDRFYAQHAAAFFKDRRYLDRAFPELTRGPITILEVGCGVGNTVFPLLEANPAARIYACDLSPTAINLVKAHPRFASGNVTAFVGDAASADLTKHVEPGSVDYATLIFMLSAVAPTQHPAVLRNVAHTLKPGSGRVLFRDYALGDAAQHLREGTQARRLGDRFFVRGDGTCAYHFEPDELRALFLAAGLRCVDLEVQEWTVDNRKTGDSMQRKWLQAVFQRDATAPQSLPASAHAAQSPKAPAMAGLLSGTWLTGAAGRLASQAAILPGVPSGRALLPETLDSADELASSLSPGIRGATACGAGAESFTRTRDTLEAELEAEFFDIISRDTQEVVSEEVAAAGLNSLDLVTLMDPMEGAAQLAAGGGAQTHEVRAPARDGWLEVAPGLQFVIPPAALADAPPGALAAELCLASLLAAAAAAAAPDNALGPALRGAQVLQLATGPGGLVGMAAVRASGARRALLTHPDRACLERAAISINANAHALVVERVKMTQLSMAVGSRSADNVIGELQRSATSAALTIILCADVAAAVADSSSVQDLLEWCAAAAGTVSCRALLLVMASQVDASAMLSASGPAGWVEHAHAGTLGSLPGLWHASPLSPILLQPSSTLIDV